MTKRRALFTKTFWFDTLERAVRTFGQAGAGVIAGAAVAEGGFDWAVAGITVGTAVGTAVLMSLAALPVGDGATGSVLPPPPAAYPASTFDSSASPWNGRQTTGGGIAAP